MSEIEKAQTAENEKTVVKMPKPIEKFIWLLISCATAALGCFLKINKVDIPLFAGIIYSLVLMAFIIIAAHKVSTERAAFADKPDKKIRYMLKTVLYYFYILVAVVCVVISIWVVGILSI
ncbi:MAG: hypothetical protein J6L62_08900 [Clostridia bacterium]|nr:hypothetical protein [Clostridia bacterium]